MVEAGLLDAIKVHLQLLDVRHSFHVLDGLDVHFLAQLDFHHLLILKVNHLLGAAHDRRGVGSDEILAVANANDHRATFTGGDELVGMTLFQDDNSIGTNHMVQCDADGLKQVDMFALLHILDEVGQHLGVGRRLEGEATFLQLLAQAHVVLDDAVVNQGDVTRHGAMRVGVHLVGFAVSGPTGMGNADVTAGVLC